jgi:alpha-L-rhamnosidase
LFKADNATLGNDPAPGSAKQLVVDYELAGERGQKIVPENGRLVLNRDVQDDWEARYARPRYLRRPFALGRSVRRALLFATALGVYEARLNGARVGDHELAPEWTDYPKRVQVQAYDVTELVRDGENVLAAKLGNGWYSGAWQFWGGGIKAIYGPEPYFLAQLEIEFEDGGRQTVITDERWRGTTEGPLQFAGIYEGATYDARAEMPGWDAPGFDDAGWIAVKHPEEGRKIGNLVWQRSEPIRVTRELTPVALTEPKPGVYVFDFGQNMVGRTRFTFRGRPGETVELQHAEICNPDGTVFTGNLWVITQHRMQLNRYTFRSDAPETFEPAFTYHGFRYVEVRGLKEKPAMDSLTGVVFNSDAPEVGSFTCSEPLLNRFAQNVLWSQRGNFMGVPTDCPQRNERCGYTGDAQFFMRAAVYNMDVAAFFSKWLMDVQDAQQPDGHFTDHAPTYGPGDGINIGWGDAGIICPYEIFRTYGDTRIIREHYAGMKRFLDFLKRNSRDDLYTGHVGNGDWLSTGGGASHPVIGTAHMAFNFKLMAEMAGAIGEQADAAAFRAQYERSAAAFAREFIDADGRIKDSSQTGYALAFTMGLVPEGMEEKMSARFAEEAARFDGHPRTGFIGTPRLLPGLHLAGRDGDAHRMLLTRTAPSWLYPVTVGATTIWEQWVAWDGVHPQGGMQSHNHYAFGAVLEYLFGMIGGIQPAAPGYRKIRIRPVIPALTRPEPGRRSSAEGGDGLSWADTRYDSIHGTISTSWKKGGDGLMLEVVIPPNTTAEVHVPVLSEAEGPANAADAVMESGHPAATAPGVKFLRMENGAAVYGVGSGRYEFLSVGLPDRM